MAGWKQTSARGLARKGNSPYKNMLTSMGFNNTDTAYLKSWIIQRTDGLHVEDNSVTAIFGNKVIQCKTIAEAVWILYTKHGLR